MSSWVGSMGFRTAPVCGWFPFDSVPSWPACQFKDPGPSGIGFANSPNKRRNAHARVKPLPGVQPETGQRFLLPAVQGVVLLDPLLEAPPLPARGEPAAAPR